jgi:hypothetical protein
MPGPDDVAAGLPLDDWLERVRSAIGAGAPDLGPDEREALLQLTRLAAHASERVAGPLTVYLLGMSVAGRDAESRQDAIEELMGRLAPAT